MEKQTDVFIAGAGIAGLGLAVLLAQEGIRVDIIDQNPPQPLDQVKPNARTTALFGSSVDLVKEMGIWNDVVMHACMMMRLQIIDDSEAPRDPIVTEFEASDVGVDIFGYNIPNDITRAALFQRAQELPSLHVHCPSAFEGYEVRGQKVFVRFAGGEIEAKLIVGADGRNSKVRELAGIPVQQDLYEQKAVTCLINHSRSHNHTSTEFHRSGGPLAFVPLPGNQSAIVWINPAARADELLALRKQDFEAALQKASNDILGGITLETGPQAWPLCSMKAKSLTAPRMALIAEAAHVMSPITAQGLNLSLRDVRSLAGLITKHSRLGLDIGSKILLDAYERERRMDVGTRSFGVDAMNRLVANDNPVVKSMRRAGLKTLDQFSVLKHLVMKQNLG